MASEISSKVQEERVEPREEVLHRTRIGLVDGRSLAVVIVNLSPHGLMIRTDAAISPGEWMRVALPIIGEARAAVRWALGGRVGCELERAIPASSYHAVLHAMR